MLVLILLLFMVYIIFTEEVTSVTFLFSVLALFLYVVPYFTLWDTFEKLKLVSVHYRSPFFELIFYCYVGFIFGDKFYNIIYKSDDRLQHRPLYRIVPEQQKYEQYTIIVGLIGVAGYGYFVAKSGAVYFYGHFSGAFDVGGYIYELRYFIFSAILLLYHSYLDKKLSKKGLYFLVFFSVLLILDAYFKQQRGSWIRFGVIFFLTYMFSKNKTGSLKLPSLIHRYKLIFVLGLLFGLLLTFTVQIRNYYSPTTSFSEQISKTVNAIMEKPDLLLGGSTLDEGNEFVTAFNAFHANEIAKQYDYGYKWLYPFINFIPRNLWTNKPTWSNFSTDIFPLMDKYSSIKHADGSAETGIIDAYYRFSWLTPFIFFLFGYWTKKLYVVSRHDLGMNFFYICLYVGCFYFFTQNMMPLIIFTLYMYIPIWFVSKTCLKKNYVQYA